MSKSPVRIVSHGASMIADTMYSCQSNRYERVGPPDCSGEFRFAGDFRSILSLLSNCSETDEFADIEVSVSGVSEELISKLCSLAIGLQQKQKR